MEKKCIINPWSKAQVEEEFDKDNTYYLIAAENQTVVGFCGALFVLDTAEITNVAVLSEHRGKNIGYKLVEQMKKELWKLGITQIFLEVRESNFGAISLYKKARFEIIGSRKNYYINPVEDALIMKFENNAGDNI